MYAKDAGAIPFLVANLSSADSGVVSAAAMALSNLAKNGKCGTEAG